MDKHLYRLQIVLYRKIIKSYQCFCSESTSI